MRGAGGTRSEVMRVGAVAEGLVDHRKAGAMGVSEQRDRI